ncbi:MAG: hypothetical protein KGL39_04735 [Patescibacteria group bacterium]|nr:hypothetical protein [Patescibacteria group bacterium]
MMCNGAICGDNHTARPWWPTDERWGIDPYKKVLTDCCYRKVFANETVCRVRLQEIPVGGFGDYQSKLPWEPFEAENFGCFLSYYEPTWTIECAPDSGCKRFPIKKRGMHLRAWAVEGI